MKYMRRTAGYTCTDYKTNPQTAKELKITPILDKLLEYKRSWIQHVNRMLRNRLPRVMKYYSPAGRRNHGRPLNRLLDTWDRNGLISGPTPWQIYDDDDKRNASLCTSVANITWEKQRQEPESLAVVLGRARPNIVKICHPTSRYAILSGGLTQRVEHQLHSRLGLPLSLWDSWTQGTNGGKIRKKNLRCCYDTRQPFRFYCTIT